MPAPALPVPVLLVADLLRGPRAPLTGPPKADDALASVWRGFETRNSLLEKYFALYDELLPRSSWILRV